ncbi:MAG: ferrochelatase [Alphaproteobacteria bacterium]|nr:MAG: ferrochelatase [Alphaproteobacteria bacterium]
MTAASQKIAVVLFNLGGPQSEEDIAPFLFNFFMDKNIIGAPPPFRWLIARYISTTRSKGAARDAYKQLGFKSPLLENTRAQAAALEKTLQVAGFSARCFVSMRYWRPMAQDVIRELNDYLPDRLVLLPLYPQYSSTTAGSSFENFWAEVQADDGPLHARWDDEMKVDSIGCYPALDGFAVASADLIRAELEKAPPGTRLLLSAHGLPEKVIKAGDPYQKHCEETAQAIVKKLGIPGLDWEVCYQSRVGPLKWIGPSIGEALEKAARDGKGVIVYPHAFVSEHVETLVELDIEYRHRAAELKLPHYGRAATVGTHPSFIGGLAALVQEALDGTCPQRLCQPVMKRAAGAAGDN